MEDFEDVRPPGLLLDGHLVHMGGQRREEPVLTVRPMSGTGFDSRVVIWNNQ
jgi:hypothetical protein